MTEVLLRAAMTLRAIARRRLTAGILIAMPIAFYFVTHDTVGRSVRALAFGISWSISTVAFFATVTAHSVDPRLRLAGWRGLHLILGRLAGLCGAVLALTAAFGALVIVDQPVRSGSAVMVTFAVTGVVAVAVGTVVGRLIARDMEGTLVLFFLAGMQAIANPFDSWSRALPFWSSRELGTWAIDGPSIGSLAEGIAHAIATVVACGLLAATASIAERGRPTRHT